MDILAQFPTRRSLVNHLESVKNQNSVPDFNSFEHDLWVKWARTRRSFRFVTLVHAVLVKADHADSTTYGDLSRIIGLGSANELNHLINHIGQLCKDNDWPPYPVLIKNQKTGRVGNGFFKFFEMGDATEEEKQKFEKESEERCFNTPLPDQVTILCRLTEYVHLNFK